jgi:hypothetical protein
VPSVRVAGCGHDCVEILYRRGEAARHLVDDGTL